MEVLIFSIFPTKTMGGRRTQKQNDSKHLRFMIGGRELPSSPFHQCFWMWDHELMRLQDWLGVFHLRTTLVVQLSIEIRRQWPERNQEGGDEQIKQTQTYDVKDYDDDDDDGDDDGDDDDGMMV